MFFSRSSINDRLESPAAELSGDFSISFRRPPLRSPPRTRRDDNVPADSALPQFSFAPRLRFRIARQPKLSGEIVPPRQVLHQVHALFDHVPTAHLKFSVVEELGEWLARSCEACL